MTVGSITFPTIVLSQSLIPIGLALTGSITLGLTGVTGIGIGIGSNVSGEGTGLGGIIGSGFGWGGGTIFYYLWNKLIRQHSNPNNPNNPNNPGHHLQQSLSFLYRSIIIGPDGAGCAGLSITITLVFGLGWGGGWETGLSI